MDADQRRSKRMDLPDAQSNFASVRVHSRFNLGSAPGYLRTSAFIRGCSSKLVWQIFAAYIAQRGKFRDASVSARSNLRQFGSNRSTNLQNRMEWFSSLVWQSSCRST